MGKTKSMMILLNYVGYKGESLSIELTEMDFAIWEQFRILKSFTGVATKQQIDQFLHDMLHWKGILHPPLGIKLNLN